MLDVGWVLAAGTRVQPSLRISVSGYNRGPEIGPNAAAGDLYRRFFLDKSLVAQ